MKLNVVLRLRWSEGYSWLGHRCSGTPMVSSTASARTVSAVYQM